MPTPFEIAIPDERLAAIRERVAAFDWRAMPDAGGWRSGVGLADLRRLVDHWLDRFDWRGEEERLNRLPHFMADVDGLAIHFIHVRGTGAGLPLLLLHGWPGSFIEFERLIEPLVEAGHDVVVPSLPGYGFSAAPPGPIGPRRVAALMHGLMTTLYGDARYAVQGGDWGSSIASWIAHDRPDACAAIHLNMMIVRAADVTPETPQEKEWDERRSALASRERGYSFEQETKPQTLAVAMTDSPVGAAAWILEKFGVWADVPRDADGTPDLWQAFDEDTLLTNIMLYVATDRFATSTWLYRGRKLEGSGAFTAGTRIAVPTAVAAFPDPVFPPPPRSLAERTYAIERWTPMDRGGHFAALEQPELLLDDVIAFLAGRP